MIVISYIYFLILALIIWIIYRVIVCKKSFKVNIFREVFINLFFIYFLIVIYLTFFKYGMLHLDLRMRSYANLIPLVETIKMFKDNFMGLGNSLYNVLGNVLLFVPLGFGIPLFFKNHNRLRKVAFYGFVASFSIELLQYLTCTNFTDIDDIIFNTLGAIIGFVIFNIFILIIERTKLINLVEKLQVNYKGSLITLSSKFLLPITITTIAVFFGILYSFTVSGNQSDEDIAEAVFTYSTGNEYVESAQFFNHKLFLQDNADYFELKIADEVLQNRYVQGFSTQVQWDGNDYGYSIALINDDSKIGVIVFGKNNDAKTITINFAGDVYSQFVFEDEYFIITFPILKELPENTTIYDIYSTGESNDLKVYFNESDSTTCGHMKYLK